MTVLSVVGARPQFVKHGVLSSVLRNSFNEIIIHTGQHYDPEMSDLFFRQLDIPKPDVNLSIGSGSHGLQTGEMLVSLEKEFLRFKPNAILCFGDTNSTLAASLTAAKLGIFSVHIEAGLRSFNRSMPEEINRIVADHTSDLLFAPTEEAMSHLRREGLGNRAILTGDIMVDSVAFIQGRVGENPFPGKEYDVLTLHRPYTVDEPAKLSMIFKALGTLKTTVVFPVHPRTKSVIETNHISVPPNLVLLPPQGYMEFHTLLKYARKVITDSGGLQKEAYLVGKPCITLRPETEWVETVAAGWNILMDVEDPHLAERIEAFSPPAERASLYGERVAERMVEELERFLS